MESAGEKANGTDSGGSSNEPQIAQRQTSNGDKAMTDEHEKDEDYEDEQASSESEYEDEAEGAEASDESGEAGEESEDSVASWGYEDKKPRFSKEVIAGFLAICMLLTIFCVMVYKSLPGDDDDGDEGLAQTPPTSLNTPEGDANDPFGPGAAPGGQSEPGEGGPDAGGGTPGDPLASGDPDGTLRTGSTLSGFDPNGDGTGSSLPFPEVPGSGQPGTEDPFASNSETADLFPSQQEPTLDSGSDPALASLPATDEFGRPISNGALGSTATGSSGSLTDPAAGGRRNVFGDPSSSEFAATGSPDPFTQPDLSGSTAGDINNSLDSNSSSGSPGFENAFDMTGHNIADDGTLTGLTMVIATRFNNASPISSGIVQTYQYNGSDFVPIGSGIEGDAADLLSFVSITRNLQNDGATSGVPSLAIASPSPLQTKYIRTFAYAHDWVPSGVYNDGSNKITKFVPNNMEKHIWQSVSSLNLFLPVIINFDVIYNVKILPGWLFCQVKSGNTMYLLVYKWNDTTFQWVENAVRVFVPFEHVGGTRGGHGEYAVSDFATYKTNGVVNSPKIAISEFNILDTWNIETGEEFKDSNSPRGMPGDGSLKNLSMSADGNYLVAGHNSEDKAATYEWDSGLNKWIEINKKRLHRPQDTSTHTYQRASSWSISRNGQCIVTLGANTQYDSSDFDRADREEIKYQWVRQTCLAEDPNNGTMTFKHPRRAMTIQRDFLLDGQDLHNFYDGWEDLTVTQYPLIPSQTKFWGIR